MKTNQKDSLQLYYLQDLRSIVGNSMVWWAINDSGYTCDIRCARVWTMDDLDKRFPTGIPEKYSVHFKGNIDCLIQHHIDHQDVDHDSKYPHTIVSYRKDLIQALNSKRGDE